jgi:RHS repeat-associated protein
VAGEFTTEGTNTYTWDARNHLSGITGAVAASFVYGPFGRRMSKTINGASTSFLYDGLNPVQELQAGAPSANMLTGLGIDEYFQRSDSSGASSLLTDALGSTLALADSSGAIQTSYIYEPFGNTTASGASSTNPFQFTGRENDGTGLYFYRARYYSATFQRFVGQDPLDFEGGGYNLYAYVSDEPVADSDPTGLIKLNRYKWRWRDCTTDEEWECQKMCGDRGVESCKVRQTFRVTGGKGDEGGRFFPVRQWVDGPPSCSCNEPPNNSCSASSPPLPSGAGPAAGAAGAVGAAALLWQLMQGAGEGAVEGF